MTDTLMVESPTGALKGQKMERYDLVPPRFEAALAEHFGRNAEEHGGKYPARNWEKGSNWSTNYAALRRHARRWFEGEDWDEEGFHHLIAVAWHAAALYEWSFTHPELDDRPRNVKEDVVAEVEAEAREILREWTETTENGITYTFVPARPADREPQPTDGPEYHAEHAAWRSRQQPCPDIEGRDVIRTFDGTRDPGC